MSQIYRISNFILIQYLFVVKVAAQEVVFCEQHGQIYKIDMNMCASTLICDIPGTDISNDITYHPNGKLYVINPWGLLSEVDLVNCLTIPVHQFKFVTSNSLTADANGVIYAANFNGDLYSFDLATGVEYNHGNTGFRASGDLTFIDGELYMASLSNEIVKISLPDASKSVAVLKIQLGKSVFGIFSHGPQCGSTKPYITVEKEIYELDLVNQKVTPVCKVPYVVGGAGSSFEFFASEPILIKQIDILPPECATKPGNVEVEVEGGRTPLQYSIDGKVFQNSNFFDNILSGSYKIYVKDSRGCITNKDFVVREMNPHQLSLISAVNESCGQSNGAVQVSGNIQGRQYSYSINGGDFLPGGYFEGLQAGHYIVDMKDEFLCPARMELDIVDDCNLFVPDIFSPNGDNINDSFRFQSNDPSQTLINVFQVYDRWGELVFAHNNFMLDCEKGCWWNGEHHGKPSASGVYIYFIEVTMAGKIKKTYSGNINLIR